jgi:hypothetical protein
MKTKLLIGLSLAAAALVVVVVVALAFDSNVEGATQIASVPPAVDQVPTGIPAGGVSMDPDGGVVLAPADQVSQASLAVSANQAIDTTPALLASGKPIAWRAVLAYATVTSTIPTGNAVDEKADTIQDRLVWVVTLTYPEPVDCVIGYYSSNKTPEAVPSDAMKSHFNALIDASTGQLVWSFFTK